MTMNKMTLFLVIAIMALSFMLGATVQSKAQVKVQGASFVGVLPFVTTSNRVGFFDQNSGKVYIYDENLGQCLFIGQISGLGKPIDVIAKS